MAYLGSSFSFGLLASFDILTFVYTIFLIFWIAETEFIVAVYGCGDVLMP